MKFGNFKGLHNLEKTKYFNIESGIFIFPYNIH